MYKRQVEELAHELDMPVDKVSEILKIGQDPLSLENPVGEEEDSHLGDFLPDHDTPTPESTVAVSYTHLDVYKRQVLRFVYTGKGRGNILLY